ncbi:MAG: hypothetical protein QFF03_12105 [Pseudomonadota bacterium]|nr:hypothetical protein [Pseudomonadota bacterium]
MLDFTIGSPKRFLNDIVTLPADGKTARSPFDRRVAAPGQPATGVMPRKRRRHDGINGAWQAPLAW